MSQITIVKCLWLRQRKFWNVWYTEDRDIVVGGIFGKIKVGVDEILFYPPLNSVLVEVGEAEQYEPAERRLAQRINEGVCSSKNSCLLHREFHCVSDVTSLYLCLKTNNKTL